MVQVLQIRKGILDMIPYRHRRVTVANPFQIPFTNAYWLNDFYNLKNVLKVGRFNIQTLKKKNFISSGQNNIILNISNKRLNKCID